MPKPPATAMYRELGLITRQLHDALSTLGVLPDLQAAVDGMPDVRSRLAFVSEKTGRAAETVLDQVDAAKADRLRLGRALDGLESDPGAAGGLLREARDAADRIDAALTRIMLAQDFHDLTSQVMAKVVAVAGELEQSLLSLLLRCAPPAMAMSPLDARSEALEGPQHDRASGRTDVAPDQAAVDELLESLGF